MTDGSGSGHRFTWEEARDRSSQTFTTLRFHRRARGPSLEWRSWRRSGFSLRRWV